MSHSTEGHSTEGHSTEGHSTAGYEAMGTTVGASLGRREVLSASGPETSGPETITWLQGQLSQDIAGLAVGDSAWTLLLAPQGKVVAWLRVSRFADDHLFLDVDRGFADVVMTRLARFKLRTRCDLDLMNWTSVSLRGPDSIAVDVPGAIVSNVVDWGVASGIDHLGPDLELPAGVVEVSDDAWTARRIEAGEPMMGAELDESTIPAAAGIVDRSVSFTKGCYTGQELVARIDSRGSNTPKRLLGVRVTPSETVVAGDTLSAAGKDVGHVTSVAFSPTAEALVALAYVARGVGDDAHVTIGSAEHQLRPLGSL